MEQNLVWNALLVWPSCLQHQGRRLGGILGYIPCDLKISHPVKVKISPVGNVGAKNIPCESPYTRKISPAKLQRNAAVATWNLRTNLVNLKLVPDVVLVIGWYN